MATLKPTSPVTEDGVLIDPHFLEQLKFRTYDPSIIEYGKSAYQLDVCSVEINTRPRLEE